MLCKTHTLTTGNSKIITKQVSKFFSRMFMNSYVTYKEQLPTGCKSMSTSNYTKQFHVKSSDKRRRGQLEHLAQKNAGTKFKHLRKLPLKQDEVCVCVCVCVRARARVRACVCVITHLLLW